MNSYDRWVVHWGEVEDYAGRVQNSIVDISKVGGGKNGVFAQADFYLSR